MNSTKRLNNYISSTGLCSRREADELIKEGRVLVNDKPAVLGMSVKDEDVVKVDHTILTPKRSFVTIAYHKPAGITCTTESHVKDNIIDAIHYPERIFPIGRLDKASEGLILLTNDGSIVNQILRAEGQHEKEYIVRVHKNIQTDFKTKMEQGVRIFNPVKKEMTLTLPTNVTMINNRTFSIVLRQGLNRQIRRMCSTLGYRVVSLKRIRIMNLTLDNLKKGHCRLLSDHEFELLMKKLK